MAAPLVDGVLRELGFTPAVRVNQDGSKYVTDQGNFILDCSGILIDDPYAMARELDSIVGVVEHGLFLDMASLALIATEHEVVERTV